MTSHGSSLATRSPDPPCPWRIWRHQPSRRPRPLRRLQDYRRGQSPPSAPLLKRRPARPRLELECRPWRPHPPGSQVTVSVLNAGTQTVAALVHFFGFCAALARIQACFPRLLCLHWFHVDATGDQDPGLDPWLCCSSQVSANEMGGRDDCDLFLALGARPLPVTAEGGSLAAD